MDTRKYKLLLLLVNLKIITTNEFIAAQLNSPADAQLLRDITSTN